MAIRTREQSPLLNSALTVPGRHDPPLQFPVYVDPTSSSESVTLGSYWQIISRHRWTVLTIMTIATTLVAILSFRTQPVYKAVARVEVGAENPQVDSLHPFYQQMPANDNFLRTQIQVLLTDNLAWRTVRQLSEKESQHYAKLSDSGIDGRRITLINEFKSHLSVELVPGSRVIQIAFEDGNPEVAAKAANALVTNYIDYNFRQQYDATREVAGRLEQQLDELKARVEDSQRSLVEYERENAIVTVSDKQNVIEQRLGELTTDLTVAQSERIGKQALYEEIRERPEQADALADNELLQKLRQESAVLENQYVEAQAQYGPAFPKVLRLHKQVEAAQLQVERERTRIVDKIHGEYLAALNRENLITSAVTQQKEQEGKLNQLLVQHNILKGEFDTNQQLYQRLLQELKDATIAAGLRTTNIHFVDPALPPNVPERPRKKQNIAMALFGSMILGILIAVAQESLDISLKSPEDIEAVFGSPTLAVIPVHKHRKGIGGLRSKRADTTSRAGGPDVALATLNDSRSPVAEAYRALRTAALLSGAPQPPRTMLITSSSAGEGKTSVALNIAITLAQSGSSVALVDCDLRKPGITRILNMKGCAGVSTFLKSHAILPDAVHKLADLDQLFVVPAGLVPPNPSELLGSEAMRQLLDELARKCKHVIIDSPPVLAVTDATILSTMVDGTIFVVESGATNKKIVSRARRILENAGGNILGVVLNKYDVRQDSYYNSYHKYGYYGEIDADVDRPNM